MFLKTFQYRVQPAKAREYLALRKRADEAYRRLGHTPPAYMRSVTDPHRWLELYSYPSEDDYQRQIAELRQDVEIRRLWPRFRALLDPGFASRVEEYRHDGGTAGETLAESWQAETAAAAVAPLVPPAPHKAPDLPVEPQSQAGIAGDKDDFSGDNVTPPVVELSIDDGDDTDEPLPAVSADEQIEEANDADADTFSADDLPAPPPAEERDENAGSTTGEEDRESGEQAAGQLSDGELAVDEWPSFAAKRLHEQDDQRDELPLAEVAPETSFPGEQAQDGQPQHELPPFGGPVDEVPEPVPALDDCLSDVPHVQALEPPTNGDAAEPLDDATEHSAEPSTEQPRNGHNLSFQYYFDDPMAILEDANPDAYSPAPEPDAVPLLEQPQIDKTLSRENGPAADSGAHAGISDNMASWPAESAGEPPLSELPPESEQPVGQGTGEPVANEPAQQEQGPAAWQPAEEPCEIGESAVDEQPTWEPETTPSAQLPMVLPENQQPLAELSDEPHPHGTDFPSTEPSGAAARAESDTYDRDHTASGDEPYPSTEQASNADDDNMELRSYDKPNGHHGYGQYPPR